MFRAKISVAMRAFSSDLRRALQTVMQIGAQGVQFDLRNDVTPAQYGDTARRQLLHYLNERGLQIASGHFPLRSPLAATERMGERIKALNDAIEFASKLKIRTLTLRAGRIPSEEDQESVKTLQGVLSELAGHGNRVGVTLSLIPCGDTAAEMRQLVDSVKTGPVTVDADLGAWVLNRQPIVAQLRELHDLIGHFEIRDAIRDYDGRGKEVPVGRGEVDWDEVAALIEEMGYNGWLNVDRQEGSDQAGDIERAVKYLKNLLPSG
ncbi:sugar phosphate isomerase/epimerase family protein [Planctomicrobium sp. SH661]|uniref:sugar phosphate isomerase/epimerase family protein n=1 Tax=Planctomicrobium sp. SH661 TaxID=3448124 RepID=UPI003F5BE1FF